MKNTEGRIQNEERAEPVSSRTFFILYSLFLLQHPGPQLPTSSYHVRRTTYPVPLMALSSLLLPPPLRKGETIGIVAPSSPQRDDERLRRGIRYFESRGYKVLCGANLWRRHGYLAGTDAERLADLNGMIAAPRVRMIIGGRGGYGMTRILEGVDYRRLKRDPKIVVGFSDLTALSCALLSRIGMASFSGAMPGVDFWSETIDPFAEESFWKSVTSTRPLGRIRQPESHPIVGLRRGIAEGPLVAGNLTLLAALVGTRYLPDMRGAILLVEEIGEEAYRVDRLLSQLYNAGILGRIAGLAFGAFTDAGPKRVSVDPLPIEEIFAEYIERAGVPAIGGVLYGHIPTKLTLPVGARVRIDGGRGEMRVLGAGTV
jgi:muramoyltetrapeptide carboxypeptidase